MDFKTIGFLVTDACTAACGFCGLRCSPKGSSVMPFSLAKKAMDEAKDMGTFERLSLSGGEVFLHADLAARILDYAEKLGFERRTLASNGFWGAWADDEINRVLSRMSACTHISFSYDAFHAEWLEPEYFWRAVRFTEERGISYSLHIADMPGEMSAGRFLESQGDAAFFHNYDIYPLIPAGRAAELPDDCFFRETDASELSCREGGVITVRYDGKVFPCCVPGIQETGFELGSLNEKTLSEMLFGSAGSGLLRLLKFPRYFSELAEYASRRFGITLPEKVVSSCEICFEIFKDEERLKEMEAFAESAHERLLLENFFKFAGLKDMNQDREG